MKILLIRHSNAGTREGWQNNSPFSDNFRPLSKIGLVQFSKATFGLTKLIKNINFIYSSQLTRALQTAEILHGQYAGSILETNKNLNPNGNLKSFIISLNKMKKDETTPKTIALVGHNPGMGDITNLLLNLEPKNYIFSYKKGSIAYFDFSKPTAKLLWLLTQEQVSKQ